MPDYSKGSIYMIKKQDDYNNDNIYIGSCCNFVRRKCCHKSACNSPNYKNHNLKVYQFIRENGGWNAWVMTKIIDYACNSKSDLNIMERRYIDEYKSKLNCIIPTRTQQEYRNDYKDKIKEYQKEYREENPDKIAERHKKYYNQNADKIKEKTKKYYNQNADKIKEKNKKYYNQNADKIKEIKKKYNQQNADKIAKHKKKYSKQYYLENKDKIAEKGKEKVNCDICGSNVRKDCLAKHKRSQKCINFKP